MGSASAQGQGSAGSVGPVLVVGYDRAPASREALRVAVELAQLLRAGHVHVMHAVDLSDYPVDPDLDDWELQGEAALAAEREQVHAALSGGPVPWTYHQVHADPVRRLTQLARDHHALMIIVGTRGEGVGSALSRLLGGSVTHGLLHRGHLPVLVVPPARHGD